MPEESDGSSSAEVPDWQEKLVLFVLVGIVAVVYGLFGGDWAWAGRLVVCSVAGAYLVDGIGWLGRVLKGRRRAR
ncbi:hypothetical protein [Cryptosporangium sp. NPDC051539]|uniref:hypothetical protein n=1 Tax=Cryptosporangium sp. NPDC051539 TaxID=3363962 RepID=UPI0037A0558B